MSQIDAAALDKVEGKLMTLVISGEGDEYSVNFTMHASVSGPQLMSAFKTAIHGLIGSAIDMGMKLGASRDEVTDMLSKPKTMTQRQSRSPSDGQTKTQSHRRVLHVARADRDHE